MTPNGYSQPYAIRHTMGVWFSDLSTVCQADQINLGTVTAWKNGVALGNTGTMTGNFYNALQSKSLANFTVISPNICDDMRNLCGSNSSSPQKNVGEIKQGDAWLSTVIPFITKSPNWAHTMVIITWDTGAKINGLSAVVACLVLGPSTAITYGKMPTTHQLGAYSIGRTVLAIFNISDSMMPNIDNAYAIPAVKNL